MPGIDARQHTARAAVATGRIGTAFLPGRIAVLFTAIMAGRRLLGAVMTRTLAGLNSHCIATCHGQQQGQRQNQGYGFHSISL